VGALCARPLTQSEDRLPSHARCPLSLSALQRSGGVLAAIRPCAEQIQPSSGLLLHISWANVGKMPTLLEGPSRSGGILAAIRPCAEQIQPSSGLLLLISWANVGKMPTLLECPSRSGGVLAAIRPCAEQIQPSSGLLLLISWANVGKMPIFRQRALNGQCWALCDRPDALRDASPTQIELWP